MNQPDDDLLWLAYRFSAGELSREEAELFEAQLAVDQTAREALAQAVGLSETVAALERSDRNSLPTVVRRVVHIDRTKWGGWVTAAVAASVALVMAWQAFHGGRSDVALNAGPESTGGSVAGSQVLVAPDAGQVGAADEETLMLLAALLDEPNSLSQSPSIEVENLVEPRDMGEPEFDLVRDGTSVYGTLREGAPADESVIEDPNATPDWLLAAVAESQS